VKQDLEKTAEDGRSSFCTSITCQDGSMPSEEKENNKKTMEKIMMMMMRRRRRGKEEEG
jgi:hypothetical protein